MTDKMTVDSAMEIIGDETHYYVPNKKTEKIRAGGYLEHHAQTKGLIEELVNALTDIAGRSQDKSKEWIRYTASKALDKYREKV